MAISMIGQVQCLRKPRLRLGNGSLVLRISHVSAIVLSSRVQRGDPIDISWKMIRIASSFTLAMTKLVLHFFYRSILSSLSLRGVLMESGRRGNL